ncbi:hypothetical protein AHAS_Ahas20G0243400 [Arachis hypogaea]
MIDPLLEPRSRSFDNLVFRSHNICEFASEYEELTVILHHAYDNAMVEMQEYKAKYINKLQNPPRVRTRGRPKNKLGSNSKKYSKCFKEKEKISK